MYGKRVIFLNWSDKPGGIEVLLPLIINRLSQFSFSAFVFRPKSNTQVSVFADTDIKPVYAKNNLELYPSLFYFLRKNIDSIFHGFNLGPFILFIIRLSRAKKIIYSIHGSIYWKTGFQKFIRKIFWKLAITDRFIFTANSEYARRAFLEKVSDKVKIKLLYNPFDTNRFCIPNDKKYHHDKLKICYTGRLAEGKNLFRWIDIAEKLLNENTDFEFNIYGDGPLKQELDAYIKNKNLANKVILHGFIKDVENVYKENDLLIFLSEYESFGNVVVESILCGTPVITSDIPAMKEIFKDYPEFVVQLDKNLEQNVLLRIKELENLKLSALRAAEDFKVRFSVEKHILELEKIYNSFE